jgi:serine-type D-Ala-D-Ala carboxypeptidase/endopeptidase (penicillin-binding protein 4)
VKHLTFSLLALVLWQGSAAAQTAAPAPESAVTSSSPAVEALRRDLSRIIAEPGWEGDEYGVMVVSLDRGDTLFALNPDRPLAPASNAKLFSTAAALYYLGPEFRFVTYLLADGPIHDGVLEGDLVLYGTGDPAISARMLEGPTAVLRALVDTLIAAGIREVRGDVVGDGSYFDDEWVGPGWQENDLDAWYGAPVGALSFAENVVSIRFQPTSTGQAAQLRTTPDTRGLAVENRVVTVGSGTSRVAFERREGRLVAVGQVRAGGGGIVRSVPVVDPANYAAAALRSVLEERGVAVAGAVRSVRRPGESRAAFANGAPGSSGGAAPRVLAAHFSPPLSEIAAVTNHVSHNLFAEALLKAVGRVAGGEGTFAAGSQAVRRFLERELGPEPVSISQVDGSGLSRNNLVTARTAVRLLDYMPRSDVWQSYFSSLPAAAVPDGLEQRMRGTAAAGNLRAKTGTIRRVSALSGYVRSAEGELLAFSILANGVPSTARAKRSEDAIGGRLAAFSRVAAVRPASTAVRPSGTPAGGSLAGARLHRVAAGETLDGIARRYGITVAALRRANPDVEPRRLQIGQRVRIPES